MAAAATPDRRGGHLPFMRTMFWLERKRLRAFLRNSLWVVPVFSMLAAIICSPLIRHIDEHHRHQLLQFGLHGARAAIGVIAASMLTFVVFFFSVLLLTVQIASGTLSPRIIARPFQSRILKASLGLFVFTFIYGVSVMGRLEERVIQLPVVITLGLSIASVATFLFVVEHVGKQLRPVTVVAEVAREGLEVIRSVFPLPCSEVSSPPPASLLPKNVRIRVVPYEGRAGVIVAFNLKKLVTVAAAHGAVIELAPQVGDFVSTGAPLFRIHGGSPIPVSQLNKSIAIDRERTMEQDPAFAFRIIVDIADKALSAAINDPTTGVLAIDQLQRLLQEVGQRNLNTGAVIDGEGELRLVYRTPSWQDFVMLAASEIRHYGAGSIQIMRRLRGMLESLIEVLPPRRAPLLQQQLELLRISVNKTFGAPFDRRQADIGDSQGLGGPLCASGEEMAPDGENVPDLILSR